MKATLEDESPIFDGDHPTPVVLAGPLRSGTTLLRLMLGSHPQVRSVGEFEEAVALTGDRGWPEPKMFRAWLAQDRMSIAKRYEFGDELDGYPATVHQMWSQLVRREGVAKVYVCTIHSRFDRVRELWPNARFIFQTRDPRDVVRSCVRMGWAGEPTSATPYWTSPSERWMKLRDSVGPENFIETRYEELVADPVFELSRCCRFLGLEFDPAMLEYHRSSAYGPPDASNVGQWKGRLSSRQAAIIETRCARLMSTFGYSPSTKVGASPSVFERIRLACQNRVVRYVYRIRRYGPFLAVSWTVVQRLPVANPSRRAIQLKINSIDERHLK